MCWFVCLSFTVNWKSWGESKIVECKFHRFPTVIIIGQGLTNKIRRQTRYELPDSGFPDAEKQSLCVCVRVCVFSLWAHVHTVCAVAPELLPPRGSPHGLLACPVTTRFTWWVILCNLSQSRSAHYCNLCRQPLHLCGASIHCESAGLFSAAAATFTSAWHFLSLYSPVSFSCLVLLVLLLGVFFVLNPKWVGGVLEFQCFFFNALLL